MRFRLHRYTTVAVDAIRCGGTLGLRRAAMVVDSVWGVRIHFQHPPRAEDVVVHMDYESSEEVELSPHYFQD